MIIYIVVFILVLLIALFVYREYKNEKKYQEERRERRPDTKKEVKEPARKPRKVQSADEIEAQEKKRKEEFEEKRRLEEQESEPEVIPEPVEKIKLPEFNYPKFDHSRLLDMGLSSDEAHAFVAELIPQIESQIPLIKEALEIPDFEEIEKLTHSIKGSSTTVGTGGIADLLVDFNTYVKADAESTVAEAYLKYLDYYCKDLKKAYA